MITREDVVAYLATQNQQEIEALVVESLQTNFKPIIEPDHLELWVTGCDTRLLMLNRAVTTLEEQIRYSYCVVSVRNHSYDERQYNTYDYMGLTQEKIREGLKNLPWHVTDLIPQEDTVDVSFLEKVGLKVEIRTVMAEPITECSNPFTRHNGPCA